MPDQQKLEHALCLARSAIADHKEGGDHVDFVAYSVFRGNGLVFTQMTFGELLVLVEALEHPDVRRAWEAGHA